jgi:hypothetical protein
MQQHYGIGVDEIWSMSWRRFVTLFTGIFSFNDDKAPVIPEGVAESKFERAVHEARGADASISRSFDWDAAIGRAPAEKSDIITTEELVQKTNQATKKDWAV